MRRLGLVLWLLPLVGCGDEPTGLPGVCEPEGPPAADAPAFDTGYALGSNVGATVHVGTRRFGTGERTGFANAALRETPLPVVHVQSAAEGACRQWLASSFNCGLGACQDGQICVGPETCADPPASAGAGALAIRVDDALATVPDTGLGLYFGELADTAGCGTVTASAPGAAFPAFALSAAQLPPLQVEDVEALHYVRGQGLTVRWTPADPGTRVRITLLADHGQHGLLWSSIVECDLPDAAGVVNVPVAMIDKHLDEFSCGACPSASITRYRRVAGKAGSTDVELLVEDEVQAFITP